MVYSYIELPEGNRNGFGWDGWSSLNDHVLFMSSMRIFMAVMVKVNWEGIPQENSHNVYELGRYSSKSHNMI